MRPLPTILLGLFFTGLAAQTAGADGLLDAPVLMPKVRLSERIKANINALSNDVGNELNKLTLGVVDMHFDLHSKQGRLNLRLGDPGLLRLHIDSDVIMRGGTARVQTRIDLMVSGASIHLEVPDFDLSTESIGGERIVQLNLPLLETSF